MALNFASAEEARRVLKIDVVIDENGGGARKLADLEGKTNNVTESTKKLNPELAAINALLRTLDPGVTQVTSKWETFAKQMGLSGESLAIFGAATGGALLGLSAMGQAIDAVSGFVKESISAYETQSGVLDVNREMVAGLRKEWEEAKLTIGEALVGNSADYTSWGADAKIAIQGVTAAIVYLIEEEKARQQLFKEGLQASFGGGASNPFGPGDAPDVDTRERNADGSLTPFGILQRNRRRLLDPNSSAADPNGITTNARVSGATLDPRIAEAETEKETLRLKREQLEVEREQKKEAEERLRYANEHVKLENELTAAIMKSKQAYDEEIYQAERLNATKIQALEYDTREAFLKATLSGGDYAQQSIEDQYKKNIGGIDSRAQNADALKRRYDAQREFQQLQLRQGADGLTQNIADELNAFRIKYQDIIGDLPTEFQAVLPKVTAISGSMTQALTSDLSRIQNAQAQTIAGYQTIAAAMPGGDVGNQLNSIDRAYEDAGLFVNRAATEGNRRAITRGAYAARGGYVEPHYLGMGGPAGTDTVQAWLTPGEGVVSRTGMRMLDALNSGNALPGRGRGVSVTLEKGAIDARGANFASDAALETLASRVATKITEQAQRIGGGA